MARGLETEGRGLAVVSFTNTYQHRTLVLLHLSVEDHTGGKLRVNVTYEQPDPRAIAS